MPVDTLLDIAERRKPDAAGRRRQLADAAIELVGTHGAHGISHPKVDRRAGVPAGTTSFYFRTRRALLHGMAVRLTELDVADLSLLDGLTDDEGSEFFGTSGLARIVMYSTSEPWLTRAKARYELVLLANRDPELAVALRQSVTGFYGLARSVVAQWQPDDVPADPALVEEQAAAVLTFVNGVIMTFVAGDPLIDDADHLDRLIRGVITGVALTREH